MTYKEINDEDFMDSILNKKEFSRHGFSNNLTNLVGARMAPQQKLLRNYISPFTPYNNILLFHNTGVGKTGSAIVIAEQFREYSKDNKTRILVLVKNETIAKNFRFELTKSIFTNENYATTQMRKDLFNTNKEKEEVSEFQATFDDINNTAKRKKILSAISRKINKYYQFLTYESFVNRVMGIKKPDGTWKTHKDCIENINNRVVIVDEVHNIVGNERQKALQVVLDKSVATRLVFLSATPAFDNPKQIIEILNLLVDKEDRATAEDKKTFFKTDKITDTTNLNLEVPKVTKKGKRFIKNASKGIVSYLRVDQSSFPKKIYNGDPILPEDEHSVKVVRCQMSSIQYEGYMKAMDKDKKEKDKESLGFRHSSLASTFVYGDKKKIYYGKDAYKKAFGTKNSTRRNKLLKGEELSIFSTKIYRLIHDINQSKGTCFVFTELVNEAGVNLLRKIFKINKISKVKFLSGGTTPEEREKIRLKFINPSNKDGSNIKVLVATSVFSEGITLKNVRNVFLLEPPWNMSRVDQVIGRAVRNQSHEDLPPEDRVVNIRLYASYPPSETEEKTIDQLKYTICYIKDRSIKEIERVLKENAIDCSLNKIRNVIPTDKPNSRECDYQECDYKCKGGHKTKDDHQEGETWMLNISRQDVQELKKELKRIFRHPRNENVFFSFEDLFYVLSDAGYDAPRDLLAYTLDYMITNQEIFRDNQGKFDLYLIQRKDKYILQHFDQSDKTSVQGRKDRIIDKYNVAKDVYGNIQAFLQQNGISDKQIKDQEQVQVDKKKLDTSSKRVINVISNPYGVYGSLYNRTGVFDDKFRIVDIRDSLKPKKPKTPKKKLKKRKKNKEKKIEEIDKRKFVSGQDCHTIKLDKLRELYTYLISIDGVKKSEDENELTLLQISKLKKPLLCSHIRDLLKRNVMFLD